MTDIEQKALALVNEVRAEWNLHPYDELNRERSLFNEALCRAIEQHEAFRQEVSDAVEWVVNSTYMPAPSEHKLRRFIIAKPDPLVEALDEIGVCGPDRIYHFRTAIAKRGGKIVWGEG